MKAFVLLLFGLLIQPPGATAAGGDSPFTRAFQAYVKVRELEEKERIARGRQDLEDEQRLELVHKTEAELEAARKDYQVRQRDGLGTWERSVLERARESKPAAEVDKRGLDFLSTAFGAKAKGWSPLAWESAGEWFGKATEDAFLKITFAMEEAPVPPALPTHAANGARVLWLTDPLSRYISKREADHENAGRALAKNQLERDGYIVEDLAIGAFARLDEQAEELHLALARRIDEGKPFTIVSSGHASAVLLRSLDLNPGLLHNPSIRGWVNVNGHLFGEPTPPTRAPASYSKADRPLHDAYHELLLLREDRLGPQTPLGAEFPVLNVVTLNGAHRPGPSLRDSLLPDAKTVYLPHGDAAASLRGALPLLAPRAPSGQRDFD